ncbi:Exo-beta-D-glucosaminidase precursor [Planctomycetes bacterium Pla163]|uniref:beta-mannosidase n=1 Tax=Rohdeia mirabilis TaxID=2528008 RepID=A0A518D1R8_9BACT|nr:Exo-beta-D-glucosaminidase precursor [Planctomycetes bacterium Pla163]
MSAPKVRRAGRTEIDLSQRIAAADELDLVGTAELGAVQRGSTLVAPADAAWTLRRLSTSSADAPATFEPTPASVPGCVHIDLERAGLIEPLELTGDGPHVDWIGRSAWSYERRFTVDAQTAAASLLELVFHGLQGAALVVLDGVELGPCENQFRRFVFDVTGLTAGEHTLEVRFRDTFEWLAERERATGRTLPGWGVGQDKDHTGAWLRASPVMFGWDFAPRAVTCGLWRDVQLVATTGPRLANVRVGQQHRRNGSVRVRVDAEVQAVGDAASAARLRAVLVLDGVRVAHASAPLDGARGGIGLDVTAPALWWPNNEGDQRLYDLWVETRDASGVVLDRQHRRIGLRTIELVCRPDRDGESFRFRVNGRDLFVRGANIVPQTLFDARSDEAGVWKLVGDAQRSNLNMLRVWGGGPYGSEEFYDECDERGILVWQDLPFSCCTYPTFDEDFRANVEIEVREQCRRLHSRPSLALICGNNELENGLCADTWDDAHMSWHDYGLLFDQQLPRVIAENAPQTAWWPGSPHTPAGERAQFNDPRSGDAHLWDVWHGEQPFEWYLTSTHRFVSEFGFQSPPDPTRLRRLVGEDLAPTAPRVAHRQRAKDGDARIDRYLAREGVDVSKLDPVRRAHLARILQARGMQLAIEHWRRSWPRCGGFLLWQLNEPWLAPSWSAFDAEDAEKPLGDFLGDMCAPRIVSIRVGPDATGERTVVSGHWIDQGDPTERAVVEDTERRLNWAARVYRLDAGPDDDELDEIEGEQVLERGTNLLFERDLDQWIGSLGLTRGQCEIEVEATTSAGHWDDDAVVPAPLGDWQIEDPKLEILGVRRDDAIAEWFVVEVRVHATAWFCSIHHPAFVVASRSPLDMLEAGGVEEIRIEVEGTRSAERLAKGLEVLTLWDLLGRS